MSRDKLKSEAGSGCKSSAESIGVHRSLSFRESNGSSLIEKTRGVHRSQSSRMSRYKLKPETRRACKSSVESLLDHRSQSSKASEHSKETVCFFTKEASF